MSNTTRAGPGQLAVQLAARLAARIDADACLEPEARRLARVHDPVARAGVRSVLAHVQGAVLSGVALERNRLGPALHLRRDRAHPLRRTGANATAVIPSIAVRGRAALALVPRGDAERRIVVLRRGNLLVGRTLVTQDCRPELVEARASQSETEEEESLHSPQALSLEPK